MLYIQFSPALSSYYVYYTNAGPRVHSCHAQQHIQLQQSYFSATAHVRSVIESIHHVLTEYIHMLVV